MLNDDSLSLTLQGQAGDDPRGKRKAAEGIEPLLYLKAIEQAVTIGVGIVCIGTNCKLNVVRQAVEVAVWLGAAAKDYAPG